MFRRGRTGHIRHRFESQLAQPVGDLSGPANHAANSGFALGLLGRDYHRRPRERNPHIQRREHGVCAGKLELPVSPHRHRHGQLWRSGRGLWCAGGLPGSGDGFHRWLCRGWSRSRRCEHDHDDSGAVELFSPAVQQRDIDAHGNQWNKSGDLPGDDYRESRSRDIDAADFVQLCLG
jgi:hypothetical protein